MAKAFSILHRAAALLVALCLLVGMALPVYAAGDESLFFGADSETIPGESSTTVAETTQDPAAAGLESVSPKVDTVSEADGASPAEDGSAPSSDTQDQEETVLPEDAPNTDEEPTTEDESNTDEEPTAEDEPMMLADDFSADDGAGEPATIADTGATSQGFIPATTTIYFEDDGRYDTTYKDKNCTIHFYAQKVATEDKGLADLNKDMVDTGKTTDSNGEKHRIFSVTLNSADYPDGGFYRVIFQYQVNGTWQEEIFAFGNGGYETGTNTHWTAIDQLAGKKFVRTDKDTTNKHFNQDSPYTPTQWKRVEYCYKGMPLYFKNGSSADLTNVTAVFCKKRTDGTVEPTASLPIGTVGANQFCAQKILIPNNDSPFVRFTWDNGESDLYNFSTDTYDGASFNLTKTNCFVYNGPTSSWQVAGSDLLTGGKTIYFDATLSSYGYDGEGLQQQPMPGSDKKMYCFLTDSDGNVTPLEMKLVKADPSTPDPTPDRKLWYCQIPADEKTYTAVQFSAVNDTNPNTAQDNKTQKYTTAEIPPTLTDPCFFADDGDPSAYESNGTPVFRDGYWGEKKSRHDAESGKNATVVDIASGSFTRQAGTKYITSTLYDYYTDYELNGLNRDRAPSIGENSQRWFVTFEQFDRALSSAYEKSKNVKYPLYTGHFEPTGGGVPFAGVAGGMKLCGWGNPNGNDDEKALYNTFMAVNNSTYDDNGQKKDNDYSRTFQGLVEKKASANGLPLLRTKDSTKDALADPHFNEDFLQGNNSFNTVLGKVYKDVSFPFTKDAVFKSGDTRDPEQYANYWYYDSSKASLYLKQDKDDGKYYLEAPKKDGEGNPTTDDYSKNITTSGPTHGFFPFNETVPSNANAAQYNYGFGAKLQFDFTLTENGNVVVKDASGNNTATVPIKFFFSGDDDVWVYIDGQLVLDVGGAHDKASGLLEFGAGSTVTPYVSSNKNTDNDKTMAYTTDTDKTVYFNGGKITFQKQGTPITLKDKLTTHTLTMFYMERGMWDSNMAVAFNFPDSNELQVEKVVDVDKVDDAFKPLFQGQNLFTFTLQNLATHYGAKPIDDNGTPTPVPVGDAFTTSSSPTVHTTMEKDDNPPDKSGTYPGQTVKWYAQGNDYGSEHRDLRYGTMELNSALDIKNRDYLSFDVYAVGNKGDGVLSTNYLYLTLVDSSGKQMGCDLTTDSKKSYLNTMLSGSVVMQNNQWVTVKLQLNKMLRDDDFNPGAIKKILIGDDYERTVYFRNFVFTAKPVVKRTVGFSVEQKDIPDYGSVNRNTLMPASGAIFTSSVAGSDAQAVDTDGTFDLQAGETVTFTDQFRRGSYISLQEAENTALYSTRWEVYENGKLVNPPLQGDNAKPEDGRAEAKDSTTVGYDGTKPANANTLVFRSYAAPDEEFPKLKVRFINTVKVGKLVIKKVQPSGETPLPGSYHFTVTFSNIGGIGLGGADGKEMTKDLAVGDSWEIPGIPVGTRFQVVETPDANSSLQDITCTDNNAQYNVVDNGVRGTVTSETEQVTAIFTNTAHQLMDIEVEKKWLDANGNELTDNLPDAIWVKLQRRHAGTDETWENATGAVELNYKYMTGKWTNKFERLDKTDVSDGTPYEYRVLESATGSDNWRGGATDDVIEISGKRYKVLNPSCVTGESTDKTLILTNQLQDAKYMVVITKQDAQDVTKKLDGVEFKLEKLKDGGTAETPVTGTTGSEGAETGELTFADLTPGNYRLTETKTAAGYTLLSEAIEFELKSDGKCQLNGTDYKEVTQDAASGVYNIALTIYNRKGFTLPHTGADAPSLWLLLGLPALVAVLLVLVFRYKKGGRRS